MQILMPQLGETVTEGTISTWHRREGETVAVDDVLFEIETDKVATEVTAPAAGILRILVTEGQTVPVGTPLAEIGDSSAAATREGAEAGSSPASGNGGSPPHSAQSSTSTSTSTSTGPSTSAGRSPHRDAHGRPLSPAVRRLATEHEIDMGRIAGSGRNGRVRRRDVLQYLEEGRASNTLTSGSTSAAAVVRQAPPVAQTTARSGSSRLIPFNRLRKRTAEHMVQSKATSPHVLQAVEVDFRAVLAIRDSLKQEWRARHGRSLTYLPFVAHAVCHAIAEFPMINGSVEAEALRVHEAVNLAIAVDLDFDGLVAPVVRDAQGMGVLALALALDDLTQRARAGKLTPDELRGGTYTISNSGSFGTLITAPIINQPQVAILSMDGIRKRPWVVESPEGDAIAIRPVGVLAQSFDHRAIDGAYSAAFLRALKHRIENSDREAWGL